MKRKQESNKLHAVSKCMKALKVKDKGERYIKCAKKYAPKTLMSIRYGQNMATGSKERLKKVKGTKLTKSKLLEGKVMQTFKDRVINIEENFLEKIKAQPTLAATIAGAGLGALYNYATDGAEHLKAEREEDLDNWVRDEGIRKLVDKKIIPEDEYVAARDHYLHSKNLNNLLNTKYFFTPFTNDYEHKMLYKQALIKYPELEKIDFDTDLSPDTDYLKFKNKKILDALGMSPEGKKEALMKDRELKSITDKKEESIKDATRDSYIKSTVLGGLALGGGHALSKKFKERYQRN